MRTYRKRRPRLLRAGLVLILSTLLLPPLLRADAAIVPLHELIGGASSVVLGTVASIVETKDPSIPILLDVRVDETLAGVELDRLLLPASESDPNLPAVQQPGTKLLVFVPDGQRIITEAEVVPLSPNHPPEPVRELISLVAASGGQLRLPAVQTYLLHGTGIPPELLGSLLQTLRETGAGGGPHVEALLEIACTSQEMYRMQAQLFAIGELGEGQVEDARPCLETTALGSENLSRRIAAVEALGTLRDPGSVKPLLSLLPRLPAGAISLLRGDEDDPRGGFGPENDPEEEGDPSSDPEERGEPGEAEDPEPDDGTPPRDGDGERELDFAPSDDERLARDEGGLVDAAVLALGKIGSPEAIPELFRVAREGDDLALHSSVVVALGMIGSEAWPSKVHGPLTAIGKTHPNDLVRELARQTLARLQGVRR